MPKIDDQPGFGLHLSRKSCAFWIATVNAQLRLEASGQAAYAIFAAGTLQVVSLMASFWPLLGLGA